MALTKEQKEQVISKFKKQDFAISANGFGKQLEEAMAAVEANMSSFARLAALHEPKVLKQMFGEALCVVEATATKEATEQSLKDLGQVIDSITHMERERSKLKNKSSADPETPPKKKSKRA